MNAFILSYLIQYRFVYSSQNKRPKLHFSLLLAIVHHKILGKRGAEGDGDRLARRFVVEIGACKSVVVDSNITWGSRDTQEDDLSYLDGANVVSVLALHIEGLVRVAELDVGGASLNKRVSIVEVETSGSLAV